MPAQDENYSNPVAPPGESFPEDSRGSNKLTNADFRRLMMTPRAPAASKDTSETSKTTVGEDTKAAAAQRRDPKEEARANERKKRKSYYARLKKEDEQKMAELAEKYRDRALERRDGVNPDYQVDDTSAEGQGAYRAVAPDLKSGLDAAERRKQMIQESKFLGGDMEHTHLVKGLDYALLQKVRSEILAKEAAEPETEGGDADTGSGDEAPKDDDKLTFKTGLGRRVYNTVMSARGGPEFNDLFLPGRMAYSIDLEADDEIPTTVIRSKADLQGIENMQATFTSNDLVIQKLSQILSYLRTGRTSKKIKKKDAKKPDGKGAGDDSIYGDIGAYAPSYKSNSRDAVRRDRERETRRERDRGDRNKARSYFNNPGKPGGEDEEGGRGVGWQGGALGETGNTQEDQAARIAKEVMAEVRGAAAEKPATTPAEPSKKSKLLEENFYTECYPDMAEMHDAIDDSDDEADYTKMDLGNKKGPIGRWDFDTQEEYSDYMNQKEALPKAAFQYGVKMADGRKTRRIPGSREKDRNAEFSREWQQIQAILQKRKGEAGAGPPEKRPKY
ncbi:RED-like N-terminal [Trinorchestia longiramus]|nr:RED-like N-terminal [Trinorchestia longiramus]